MEKNRKEHIGCFTPEEYEERRDKIVKASFDIRQAIHVMYSPYSDAGQVRRRLFEVGVEIASAACDFYQNAHENTRVYRDVMQTLVDLDEEYDRQEEDWGKSGEECLEEFMNYITGGEDREDAEHEKSDE